MRHDIIEINHKIGDALKDVVDFANRNTGERDLVLLVFSHYDNEHGDSHAAVADLLKTMGISFIDWGECYAELPHMTLDAALKRSQLPGGGHVLATLGCTVENYEHDITCTWSPLNSNYCTDNSYTLLWNYIKKVSVTPPQGESFV